MDDIVALVKRAHEVAHLGAEHPFQRTRDVLRFLRDALAEIDAGR